MAQYHYLKEIFFIQRSSVLKILAPCNNQLTSCHQSLNKNARLFYDKKSLDREHFTREMHMYCPYCIISETKFEQQTLRACTAGQSQTQRKMSLLSEKVSCDGCYLRPCNTGRSFTATCHATILCCKLKAVVILITTVLEFQQHVTKQTQVQHSTSCCHDLTIQMVKCM